MRAPSATVTTGAAGLAAIGAAAAAASPLAGLVGLDAPRWAPAAGTTGRALAGLATAVVAAWFAGDREGPAGFLAVVAALFGAVAGLGAAADSAALARAAMSTGLVATGVCLLAVGASTPDPRLTRAGQRAAAVVGVAAVGAALLAPLLAVALVGWAGWAAWLTVHLGARASR